MKIERIDDKTVKCFLSNKELKDYDITYKDFMIRSEKAKIVVEEIIEQAEEQVGYQPPQFAFDLQIMMITEKGMILTFIEKLTEKIKNNEQLMDCRKEKKKLMEEKKGNKGKQTISAPTFAIFRFESLYDIYEFVKVLPKNLIVASRLYIESNTYYLYLEKGSASYKRYIHTCIQALEFGLLHSALEERVQYLMEHG